MVIGSLGEDERLAAKLAIYDLDRTLVRLPTWTPFLLSAIMARAPWRLALAPVAVALAVASKLGLLSRRSLKEMMHRLALGTLTPDAAATLARRFAARFERHISPIARARIAADRRAGYRIVIATAAYDFYAAAFAQILAVDALIATRAMRAPNGDILPRIDGDNCYGDAKLAMIRDWMEAQHIDRAVGCVRFYSDHISDAPTFDWADEAFAVNPEGALRRMAIGRGWPVLDWR